MTNLKSINADELHLLTPAIREAWRTDNLKVFLAICMKESVMQGMAPEVVIASSCVVLLQWLSEFLERNNTATASVENSTELAFSLLRESVTLAANLS